MQGTAAQASEAATQATAAATAYETAFAAHVPPTEIAANRSQLASLVATNVFGQNTAAIAATEVQYAEMWAQDAVAMDGYAASSAAAAKVTPFTAAPQITNGSGTATQAAAVAAAAATPAGSAQSLVPNSSTRSPRQPDTGSAGKPEHRLHRHPQRPHKRHVLADLVAATLLHKPLQRPKVPLGFTTGFNGIGLLSTSRRRSSSNLPRTRALGAIPTRPVGGRAGGRALGPGHVVQRSVGQYGKCWDTSRKVVSPAELGHNTPAVRMVASALSAAGPEPCPQQPSARVGYSVRCR